MFVSIYQLFTGPSKAADEKVTIKGEHWSGEYSDGHKFRTVGPATITAELIDKLDHAGKDQKQSVPYELEEKEESSLWTLLLGSWLPMLALVFIFFLFMRQLQSGGGKAMSFGKSKAKLLGEHQSKVTFADVAGVHEAPDEVEDITPFPKDPKKS